MCDAARACYRLGTALADMADGSAGCPAVCTSSLSSGCLGVAGLAPFSGFSVGRIVALVHFCLFIVGQIIHIQEALDAIRDTKHLLIAAIIAMHE